MARNPRSKPLKLKDLVLRKLDKDPEEANRKFEELTNDELIDHIASSVYTDFGFHQIEDSTNSLEEFDQLGVR